jgi:microcystin-dependent protein
MASDPARLWCGVPVSINPNGRIEVAIGGGGAGGDFTTGDAKFALSDVAEPGWIIMDDGTIGDAESGASTRANDDCRALFELLWELGEAIAPTPSIPGDPLWENVVLLVGHEHGAVGTSTFIDQAKSARALTTSNPGLPRWTAGPNAPPVNLASVMEFTVVNFNNSQLQMANGGDFAFSTGAFCIEAYFKPTEAVNQVLVFDTGGNAAQAFQIDITSNQWRVQFAGWGLSNVAFAPVTVGQWQHVAMFRVGNNLYAAKDGVVSLMQANQGIAFGTNNPAYVGALSAGIYARCEIAGLRITKGASRYTADNFTPPTLPYPRETIPESPGERGESAEEDWAAHKQIRLPRQLGRAPIAAGQGAGLTMRLLGEWFGEEGHAATINETPVHTHGFPDPTHNHAGYTQSNSIWNGYVGYRNFTNAWLIFSWYSYGMSFVVNGAGTGVQLYNNGSSAPFNVMQPSTAWNLMLKL